MTNLTRRGLLVAALAAAAAPAIARAGSLMPIYVPRQRLTLLDQAFGLCGLQSGDATIEGWVAGAGGDPEWRYVAVVRRGDSVTYSVDGLIVTPRQPTVEAVLETVIAVKTGGLFPESLSRLDELRVTRAARLDVESRAWL